MRNMMLIPATVFLLVFEAWSLIPVVRNLTFNKGSDVNLSCSDKTWNEAFYVIWNIQLKDKACKVSFSNHGRRENTCEDGKSLRNTSRAQSYLHIPNFDGSDEGVYKCEFVFSGGNENYWINVNMTVAPDVSVWLERGDKMVAVCKAERGKPAANISWTHGRHSPSVETRESDGSITVESRLELDNATDTKNLSCAVRHPYWKKENIVELEPKPQAKPQDKLLRQLLLAGAVVGVLLVGFAFFARKKSYMLRRCRQCDSSQSKCPPTEDAEEVEPYASYVQRVNSIYN